MGCPVCLPSQPRGFPPCPLQCAPPPLFPGELRHIPGAVAFHRLHAGFQLSSSHWQDGGLRSARSVLQRFSLTSGPVPCSPVPQMSAGEQLRSAAWPAAGQDVHRVGSPGPFHSHAAGSGLPVALRMGVPFQLISSHRIAHSEHSAAFSPSVQIRTQTLGLGGPPGPSRSSPCPSSTSGRELVSWGPLIQDGKYSLSLLLSTPPPCVPVSWQLELPPSLRGDHGHSRGCPWHPKTPDIPEGKISLRERLSSIFVFSNTHTRAVLDKPEELTTTSLRLGSH